MVSLLNPNTLESVYELCMLIGKPAPEVSQAHLSEIHALKETLKEENDGLKETKRQLRELQDRIKLEEEGSIVQSSLLQGNAELRERIQADERKRLERENAAILKEKLDNLKLEIEQEKAEMKVITSIKCTCMTSIFGIVCMYMYNQ